MFQSPQSITYLSKIDCWHPHKVVVNKKHGEITREYWALLGYNRHLKNGYLNEFWKPQGGIPRGMVIRIQ